MSSTRSAMEIADRWEEFLKLIQSKLGDYAFERWFAPIRPLDLNEGVLSLSVPNPIHQFFIESNYSSVLEAALKVIYPDFLTAQFVVLAQDGVDQEKLVAERSYRASPRVAIPEEVLVVPSSKGPNPLAAGLQPHLTFDTFVAGPNSKFTWNAAQAVADKPGRCYNPLFIYGSSGLGKTHLLHAIGNRVLEQRKKAKVLYVEAEKFTNEFVEAVRSNGFEKFRDKFRRLDLLLIDDVQFFANKDSTQEEFFHTFNTLFNAGKQIVLASDEPPNRLPIEHRLISRFEWGLSTEILAPGVETRKAILLSKIEKESCDLLPETVEFMANSIRSNVRKLEGALMSAMAFHSLHGRSPTAREAEDLLKDVLSQEAANHISLDKIQRKVAEVFDIRLADMTSRRRTALIAQARQIAMFLSRKLTTQSLQDIGEVFGGRDHGTVIHAVKQVSSRMESDDEFRRKLERIEDDLRR